MNTLDQSLIRGWCAMCDWDVLADYAGDDVDAKMRVKEIKRHLSAKARYYGRVEDVGFWVKPRSYGRKYCMAAEKSLAALLRLPAPIPSPSDPLSRWFDGKLIKALPKGIATLADLSDFISSAAAIGPVSHPGVKLYKKTILNFFKKNEGILGKINSKSKPPPYVPYPLCKPAPLGQVIIPGHLDGRDGSNRAGPGCRLNAASDKEALDSWLSVKGNSQKTRAAYKKELERLLLWSLLERHKPLSSLTTDDAKAYQQWLKALDCHNQVWVSTKPTTLADWKPFYCRMSRKDLESGLVLTTASVNYALTVIKSCMSWLVSQHYLKHNNFDAVQALRGQTSRPGTRLFNTAQFKFILAYAKKRADAEPTPSNRRDFFILTFGFFTGLRLSELAMARVGDIEKHDRDTRYVLKVVGKGNKERSSSLPGIFIKELHSYLKFRYPRNYEGFSRLNPDTPLIANLKSGDEVKPLSSNALHHALSVFFQGMLADLKASGVEDPGFIDKLELASTHWLRHSYASYLVNDRHIQLSFARDELGHSNIATTSIYLNAEEWERQKVIGESFDTGIDEFLSAGAI